MVKIMNYDDVYKEAINLTIKSLREHHNDLSDKTRNFLFNDILSYIQKILVSDLVK